MKSIAFSALASIFVAACAADPGTQPHDMSMASHEAAATQADQATQGHGDQYNPSAESKTQRCAGKAGCWTSISNPTKEHDADAQQQRGLATKHRAASAALGQAESQACVGVSQDDRDMSPFFHREDIQSAGPLEEPIHPGRETTPQRVGEYVVFRAVPGMTAEWLQRVVDCHIARSAAMGHQMPEMEYCPLALNNVSAKVSSTGSGFAVSIKSKDPATVLEIVKRSEALVPSPSAATIEAPQAAN